MSEAWVDGITFDYAEQGGDRLGSMELGMLNCAKIAHGITEAVNPQTGETHAVVTPEGMRQWRAIPGGSDDFCVVCYMKSQRDGDPRCKIHHPPDRRGMCQMCWLEMQQGSKYVVCTLHGAERKIEGVIGCPICALDPSENEKRLEHDAKVAEVTRVNEPEPDADVAAAPAAPIVVVGARDAVARAAALSRRIAARSADLGHSRG